MIRSRVSRGRSSERLEPIRPALLAEFDDPEALRAAIAGLRELGYRQLDAYTPYEVPYLDEALGVERTRLTWIAWPLGFAGAAGAYLLQWFANTVDYPLDVGGRPLHPWLAYVPITFETLVLVTGTVAFAGWVVACGLPKPADPLFEVEGFDRASVDRFFLGVDGRDPRFDRAATAAALAETGALRVLAVPGRAAEATAEDER